MYQSRCNRGIDSTRKSADDSGCTDFARDALDLTLDECSRRPVRLCATDSEQEIRDDLSTTRSVRHLRVEQHAVNRPRLVSECGDRITPAGRGRHVSLRRPLDVIAMAHPGGKLFTLAEPVEQARVLAHRNIGATILALPAPLHLRTFHVR